MRLQISIHRAAFLLLVMLYAVNAHAQHMITISGYVTELKSGERVNGATAYIPSMKAGTATNAFGFYTLTVPAGTDSTELIISYLGFDIFTKRVSLNVNSTVDARLNAAANELTGVVVKGAKSSLQEKTQMSSVDLSINTIKSLPAFLGEVDIMKALQLLPGIQAGGEGNTGLFVRGGSTDQNLILLDGVPVYNASHLFGFFSVFNADAIRSVEVTKGGFPARYGGRLSSVIDISMKEGDKTGIHGEGGIGIIASRLMLEGPIKKNKSSFMISGRRTYIDLLTKLIEPRGGYNFYDVNAKINFQLGVRDHIYFSGYFGNDKFYAKSDEDNGKYQAKIKWGNITGVGRWNHQFSPKLFGNLTTYYSRYKFGLSSEERSTAAGSEDYYKLSYASGIEDVALKYDFDYRPRAAHYIRAGVGVVHHAYKPGAQQTKVNSGVQSLDTTIGANAITALEGDVYAEDDVRITDKLKANIGVHGTIFNVRGKTFTSLQPRVSARYLLNSSMSIKASYTQMVQYIHLLSNSTIGLPTDLWVPATDSIKPQASSQYAAGFAYTHPKGYEISVEGYYKTMDNVIEYREGASFLNTNASWEGKIAAGKGWSYGAELLVQKKKGRLTGLLGYTLSWTNRRFDELNNGKTFPYRYDRRHDLKIAAVYNFSKHIDISCEWVYGTGNAMTLPIETYYYGQNRIIQYGERNAYRMPAYHRADVSVKFAKPKRWGERSWIISVYNVYNRRNPYFIYQTTDDKGNAFKQVSLFPVIPSISYQFKF